MRKNRINGFTLVELLCIISFACIIFPVTIPAFMDGMSKARDVEAKANLHTIQIAIERYNTDNREYPPYLLGGDTEGWDYWHKMWDESNPDPKKPANCWVREPLIEYDYLASYPVNPFIDNSGSLIIDATAFTADPWEGDGDPRFGYRGNIMGMGLDDPNYFEDAHPNLPYSRIETKRTLDRGVYDPTKHGFLDRNAHLGMFPGLYYNFGGRYNANVGKDIKTFWPGNFFYRGYVEVIPSRGGYSWPFPNTNYQGMVTNYFLGVWGGVGNEGVDVIRLQNLSPDWNQEQMYWRFPPPWSGDKDFPCGYSGSYGMQDGIGLPAVFGGGDAKTGPFWPPDRDPEHPGELIFGAPDGVKDGIILTLTGPKPNPQT